MFRRLLLGLTVCASIICVTAFAENTFSQGSFESSDATAKFATTWKGTCTVCKRVRTKSTEKRPTDTTCFKVTNGDRCKGTVIWQAK